MNMDFFNTMYMPIVIAACLILGFIIKQWIPADNKWIPTILAVFGIVVAIAVSWPAFGVETIIAGAFSGLASTGLHQAFKQLIANYTEDTVDSTDVDAEAAAVEVEAAANAAKAENAEAAESEAEKK